jgi:hypothetical protein
MLENRKQKRDTRRKRVYVSPDLVAQLQLLARERRTGYRGFCSAPRRVVGRGCRPYTPGAS